ncbi:MAG: AAA family ATPase [Gammaproteobacteria bacterium]|nr:AAA family ATPase [Gammaproteobacteria bacterium]
MRIAVSGTHFIGKSTLIEDFIKNHPNYKFELEPYYKLQDEKTMELSLESNLDSLKEQLDYSINLLNKCASEQNIIFDRCPVDFIAYAMCALDNDAIDINDSEISERFPDIKAALNNLDLIVFLPIAKENSIDYTEENPAYRKAADKCFKKIYRDDICDLFPRYNHPRIVEISGDRMARLKNLESYLI